MLQRHLLFLLSLPGALNACALSTTSNKILSHRERAPRPGKATITTTTCPGKATATTTTTNVIEDKDMT